MSDEEFSTILGFTGGLEKDVCLKIREITAAQCKMEPNLITPNDDTDILNRKTFDGWDQVAALLDLESAFDISLDGVELPNFTMARFFLFYKEKPTNYGDWVKKAVHILMPAISKTFHQPRN